MAIIVGDIHGNVEKVKAWLAYKPEEVHVALGDYLDSFFEPPERQIEALRLLLKSRTVLLWGNHEIHYCKTWPWICMGHQSEPWLEKYINIITRHKSRFKAAHAVDGWLCTHAGCKQAFLHESTNVVDVADFLNAEFDQWSKNPIRFQRPSGCMRIPADSIFQIGRGRGGDGSAGGIFWFDHKRESGLASIPQIFGHTESEKPVQGDNYICLDTTNTDYACWVYDTSIGELVELSMPYRRIRDLPSAEREPFTKYMYGRTAPFIEGEKKQDGYWVTDYREWKRLELTKSFGWDRYLMP